MPVSSIRGKSLKAMAYDIADGYVAVNPLFLKPLDIDSLTGLYHEIMQVQIAIRGEKVDLSDQPSLRTRNVRLQRLYSSLMIIKNFARERRIVMV
ncbi:MAG: hypothetical protein COZ31_09060 [Nitrospirae bacterium CG_4_10_14_3_um_filter_44_29]|nr:hypothetical protein [Nitrospirota bacterium]OIO31271.1 MAG: hypothetical protein AUJ60_01745 [Nitrospirae bacterium CG1_02_44_142]PIP70060.1 MAG: hypothetical protein COW90_07330 [Nitrospirae bacterium CG22_combo_CG10-13_8_21_14_all_44_11]PIV40342.1 MAG: hypothetical protein COS28_09310 [Nitrospirae bacterium CG02_land_8_20_14_3_00_44_33]PIV67598.1 MAG: hypothetical protein COS10_00320 [Nitrospirae bacterium CG01_land_8_20_14_3_00_44_22]PIW90736.1 MAG: hypothetical protein COZ93_00480 [Nit